MSTWPAKPKFLDICWGILTWAYSCPSSLNTSSLFINSLSFFPLRLFLPPFPLFFCIAQFFFKSKPRENYWVQSISPFDLVASCCCFLLAFCFGFDFSKLVSLLNTKVASWSFQKDLAPSRMSSWLYKWPVIGWMKILSYNRTKHSWNWSKLLEEDSSWKYISSLFLQKLDSPLWQWCCK